MPEFSTSSKVLLVLVSVVVIAIAVIAWKPRVLAAFQGWFDQANPLLAFVAILLTLAGAYFGAVEWRVRTLLKDQEFVRRVAEEIRHPTLVFDSNGTVLYDQGAMDLLAEPPRFVPAMEEQQSPMIVIAPKVHLAPAPLLQVLDAYPWDFRPERGEGLRWVYQGVSHVGGFAEGSRSPNPRFRLEIVR